MVLSINLKFNKFNEDHFFSYPINFGVSRRYSFFTGYTKYHALLSTGSKYLRAFQYLLQSVTKLICSVYLSLYMVITGKYVNSIYSSFAGKF